MGIEKGKKLLKKKRVLTKRQKMHRRVQRVHRAIQHKRRVKVQKKKKAAGIRRRKVEREQNHVVEMADPQEMMGNITRAEQNLLQILGLGNQSENGDWQLALQKKLREVEQKSLDNPEVRRVYSEIGRLFSRYRSGKVPKAFKIIPNLQKWRQILELTRPAQWTSHAMAQAVNIFASNFDPVRAQVFYRQWLIPAIKKDLAGSKKLNVHLYDALKKALYKTNAWFKGILFEMCSQNTLLRQIKTIQSILSKMTIPMISASVAMLKLMQMQPTTAVIHYLSALLGKHYTLPKRVLTKMTQYMLNFYDMDGEATVMWQNLLLTLAKQYSQSLDQMGKASLIDLAKHKSHKIMTPQIVKYLS